MQEKEKGLHSRYGRTSFHTSNASAWIPGSQCTTRKAFLKSPVRPRCFQAGMLSNNFFLPQNVQRQLHLLQFMCACMEPASQVLALPEPTWPRCSSRSLAFHRSSGSRTAHSGQYSIVMFFMAPMIARLFSGEMSSPCNTTTRHAWRAVARVHLCFLKGCVSQYRNPLSSTNTMKGSQQPAPPSIVSPSASHRSFTQIAREALFVLYGRPGGIRLGA
jgi:hypothetical protein